MVNKIIADYLKANKRLVVPQFGAFIHKENDGTFAFVPFLKKDDGVLIQLIGSAYGVNPADAQTAIDGFIADVKENIATQGTYAIEGIGLLKTDTNGSYYLDSGRKTPSDAIPPARPEQTAPAAEPLQRPVVPPAPQRPTPTPGAVKPQTAQQQPATVQQSPQQPAAPSRQPAQPASQQRPAANMPPQPAPRPSGFSSPQRPMQQAPQPGQQRQPFQPPMPGPGNQPPGNRRPQPGYPPRKPTGGRPAPKRTKADGFIAIAIIVAVIALAVMIFGYMVSREGPDIESIIAPSQTDTTTQSAAADGN